jgi:16S rRNA (adenine1518-N6/adenine1519-N6)-dimethyltransferase
MISGAGISKKDTVLEIGAGKGVLTEMLSNYAKKVIAVEKDKTLCAKLFEKFESRKNIKIICEDILTLNFSEIAEIKNHHSYKIVANIPYYITGRVFRFMFEKWPRPKEAILMVQKEVAEKAISKPPNMNKLAAILQYFSKPKIISIISPGAFYPPPRVESAILALKSISKPKPQDKAVISTIAAGFSHPRKMLISNLKEKFGKEKANLATEALGLSKTVRPQDLSISDWIKLSTILEAFRD